MFARGLYNQRQQGFWSVWSFAHSEEKTFRATQSILSITFSTNKTFTDLSLFFHVLENLLERFSAIGTDSAEIFSKKRCDLLGGKCHIPGNVKKACQFRSYEHAASWIFCRRWKILQFKLSLSSHNEKKKCSAMSKTILSGYRYRCVRMIRFQTPRTLLYILKHL